MDWQGALLSRLRANPGVTALVGAKSYWDEAPQPTERPYVTLDDVTEIRGQTLKNWDLSFARVQINAWADTKAETIAIINAAIEALAPGGTHGGRTFQRAEVELVSPHMNARDGTKTVRGRRADLTFFYT